MFMTALAAALLTASPSADDPSTREDLMDRIERVVRLPPGAAPIERYARVYTVLTESNADLAWPVKPRPGGLKVLAVYSLHDHWVGRRWEMGSLAPSVVDGGCGVVTLVFDAAADRIEMLRCNGEA